VREGDALPRAACCFSLGAAGVFTGKKKCHLGFKGLGSVVMLG